METTTVGSVIRRYALIVFLVALVIRVIWALVAKVTPISDFATYDAMATRWLETGHFGASAYRTPGYPAFLAAIYAVSGHSWVTAKLTQAVLGAVTSGLLVLLASRVVAPRTGLIAGLFYALSPTAIIYVAVLASENLAVLLVIVSLLCVACAGTEQGSRRYLAMAGSGLCLGLLLLVRPAGLYFLPGWIVVAAYSFPRREWRLGPALVAVCVAGVVLAPWLIRNHLLGYGAFRLSTTGGINAWMGNNEDAITGGGFPASQSPLAFSRLSPAERDSAHLALAIAWVREHPGRYLELSAVRLQRMLWTGADSWAAKYLFPCYASDIVAIKQYYGPDAGEFVEARVIEEGLTMHRRAVVVLTALRAVVAPLLLFGLLLAVARWRNYALVLAPALAYIAGLSLIFAKERFRELCDPLLIVPLAALLSDLAWGTTELGGRPSRRAKMIGAAVLAGATVAWHIYRYLL